MRRSRSLLLLLLIGCGGRDPLLGVDEEGVPLPPLSGTGGSTGTGGTTGTKPPVSMPNPLRDAGAVMPPVVVPRDAAAQPRFDASPPTMDTCAFPKCVAALQDSCTPTGSCVQQRVMGGGGIGTNVCFSNGVKLMTSISGNGRNVTIRVMRADGNGCYTIEPEPRGGGVVGLNYRTPSGEIVATATMSNNRLSVVCIGQSAPQVVAASCQPGLVIGGCNNGSCQ